MNVEQLLKKHIVIDNKVYFFSQVMSYHGKLPFAVLVQKTIKKDPETQEEKISYENLYLPLATLINRASNQQAKVVSDKEAKLMGQVVE